MSVLRPLETMLRSRARFVLLAAVAALTAACAAAPVAPATRTAPPPATVAGAALASAEAPTGVVPAEAVSTDDNEVICREIEVTGTRFGQRICRTRAEWAIATDRQRRAAQEYTRQSRENAGVLNPVENRGPFGSPAATFPADPALPRQ